MKVRCYCCGEAIKGQSVVLVSYTDEADRVFLFKPEHVEKVDKDAFRQQVMFGQSWRGFKREQRKA